VEIIGACIHDRWDITAHTLGIIWTEAELGKMSLFHDESAAFPQLLLKREQLQISILLIKRN
jgi:hypothetical protein